MDGKILSLFRKGSLLRQMYYGGYEDFDGANGGVWKKYINIPITTIPSEYAQYLIEIDDTNVSVYNVERTLKAQSSIASEFWSLVRSDGFDIRAFDHLFRQLYFWVEEFDYTNKKAKIWVKLPENSEELNIAFGNEKASDSSYNNGNETFEFFDDFEGTELDTTKWTVDSGNWFLETLNGHDCVAIEPGADNNYLRAHNTNFNKNFVIEVLIYATQAGDPQAHPGIIFNATQGYNDQIYFRPHSTAGNIQYAYFDGSLHLIEQYADDFTWNTWHKIKLVVKDNTVDIFVDDVKKATRVGLQFQGTYFNIGLLAHIYGKDYFDFIGVLKLADPATFATPRIIEF